MLNELVASRQPTYSNLLIEPKLRCPGAPPGHHPLVTCRTFATAETALVSLRDLHLARPLFFSLGAGLLRCRRGRFHSGGFQAILGKPSSSPPPSGAADRDH